MYKIFIILLDFVQKFKVLYVVIQPTKKMLGRRRKRDLYLKSRQSCLAIYRFHNKLVPLFFTFVLSAEDTFATDRCARAVRHHATTRHQHVFIVRSVSLYHTHMFSM